MIPGLGTCPGEGNGYPPQYFSLENSIDRGAGGLQSWGHKESDMTKQLTLSFLLSKHCTSHLKMQTLDMNHVLIPNCNQTIRNIKMPWRWEWLPTPIFWPGEFHGQSMGSQRVGQD